MSIYGAGGCAVVVYDHSSWSGYLIERLLPEATRLVARHGDTAADVLDAVPPGISVFVFHVDLTWAAGLPEERGELTAGLRARDLTVLNHDVIDISKRWVQASCARIGLPVTVTRRHGGPDDLVIVKTNRNHGGVPDLLARRREQGERIGPGDGASKAADYVVLRRREVGDEVWTDPELIVENYVSNTAGQRFRAILLAGSVVFFAHQDHRKVARIPPDGSLVMAPGSVPQSVRTTVGRFAEHCRIDYGAVDLVVDDAGLAYVVDYNSTPFWGRGDVAPLRRLLADPTGRSSV